jgi:hypothetical protein
MPDLRAGLPAPAQGDEVGLPGGLRAPPWRIEKSFRMSKHDLQARPVYHHKRESIEAQFPTAGDFETIFEAAQPSFKANYMYTAGYTGEDAFGRDLKARMPLGDMVTRITRPAAIASERRSISAPRPRHQCSRSPRHSLAARAPRREHSRTISIIVSSKMPHIAYLVVQQNISPCCRADNFALAWIPGSPNQFRGSPFST